ncbi:MAG: YlbF family regulator [Streptococcaceae bacterium]|jgi:cell fate (sporulation/competence/biofilm development) regulator YlbF (YheA/YmcA/DUF963 family)|nr:YlbF family regulator [Streptococcaceae bacterium]
MANIYDTANQLDRELRQTAEYQKVAELMAEVAVDAETKALYDEFLALQQELQDKFTRGEQLSEEEQTAAQAQYVKLQENAILKQLFASEQALQVIVNDLQQIILKPIQELYGKQD